MTYTDATVSGTGTYSYQVSCVNYSSLEGPKSDSIVLKNGQVTEIMTVQDKTVVPFSPVSRCWNLDNGRLNLKAGIIDMYDIRGCFLKTVSLKNGGSVDVRSLLGPSASENLVVVRNRAR
jgi:hypothetical protein